MKKLCFLIAFTLFAVSVEAKILYVDGATGNDSVTYTNNDENHPWATIGRASWGSTNRNSPNSSEAAQAGDTVIIKAGIYTGPGTGERYDPQWNPVNSGTSGNPITFQAVGFVDLRQSSSDGPLIGAMGRDYIIWKGFYIDERNYTLHGGTGPIVLWGCNYCEIHDTEVNGFQGPYTGNNHNGIRIHNANHVLVKNNKLHGVRNSVADENATGITLYGSSNSLIENNEIYDNDSGIYIKGGNTGPTTIRYNYIHDNSIRGFQTIGGMSGQAYQNVIKDCGSGVKIMGISSEAWPGPHTVNFRVVNNTIDNVNRGIYVTSCTVMENNIVWNNIVNDADDAIEVVCAGFDISTLSPVVDFEHNLYNFNGRLAYINYATRYTTMNAWTSATNQDLEAPASFVGNPQFVNEANGNYRLSASSPARNAGIDILDLDNDGSTTDFINLGAYITGNEQIGIRPSQPPVVPMPPSNVQAK